MKALLTLLISSWVTLSVFGQVARVEIGVDGLTCSQCTRSTELALRKLTFVKDVKMDLTNTNGVITFRENSNVNFEEIAQAVVDAGFSVRYLHAIISFEAKAISKGDCVVIDDQVLVFENSHKIGKSTQVTFLGKGFMPKVEAKKWIPPSSNSCDDSQMKVYLVRI